MSKILVVGGAGYIGGQTNLYLLESGFETVVLDNMVNGHKKSVPEKSPLVQGDLGDKKLLYRLFTEYKFDAVVHFAAYTSSGDSVRQPFDFYENNVSNTLNLLTVMREFGLKKVVFSSSAAVYGNPVSVPILENQPKNPISPYGKSKWMVEQILDDASVAYGIESIKLRYFNACGADLEYRIGESHHPETHLIPLILKATQDRKEAFDVYGNDYDTPDGTCLRDYIHVCDLATAHIKALQTLLSTNGVCESLNLGTGKGYSVLEVIEMVKKVTKFDLQVNFLPRRIGDPDILVADAGRARHFLGWQPEHSSLETIINTAWHWMTGNRLTGSGHINHIDS